VLNPDIRVPSEQAVEQLLAVATRADIPPVVAPHVVAPSGTTEDAVRAFLTPASLLRRALGARRPEHTEVPARLGGPFYWFAGMCLLIEREHFLKLRGFDERFYLYCEDFDFCARHVLEGGELIHAKHVTVIHAARRDSHRSLRHLKWHLGSLARVWTSVAYWRLLGAHWSRRLKRPTST